MTDQKGPEEELPKQFDKTTAYGAAIVCVRQMMNHERAMNDVVLKREARDAHKFVAINMHHAACTIIMLPGTTFEEAKTKVSAIAQMLRAEEKALREKKPDIQVVK